MGTSENMPQLLLMNGGILVEDDSILTHYLKDGFCVTQYKDLDINRNIVILDVRLMLTPNWLKELQQTAQSYVNIGTVSPLWERKLFDKGLEKLSELSLEKIEDILKACFIKENPDSTENYFECIFIKHELLQDMGIPNIVVFQDAEETKRWFDETLQLGWKHKICASALARECAAIHIHQGILTQHGEQLIQRLSESIKVFFELHLENGRKSILHYLLADFQEGMRNNVGGTQFHVADLVEYQRHAYNVFVLARDGEYLHLTEYADDDKWRFDFWVGDVPENISFYDKQYEDICELIIKCFGIDLVHIHHTLWMTLDIFHVASKYGAPIILSIHDFYFVCPILKMINPEGRLCDKSSCSKDCSQCLKKAKGISDGKRYLAKCRREYQKIIDLSTKVIHPSNNALKTMGLYYPELEQKALVVEHGICLPMQKVERDYNHEKKHIAFIGGISDIKGGPVIYDLITRNPNHYEWYIMGGIAYSDLYNLKQKNLHKTGWYRRYDIYKLLMDNEIDLVCILSTVAETFCYTLSEAIAAGIPVLATDVGALGSRMKELDCGWLVPRDATAEDIEPYLKMICTDPELYQVQKRKALSTVVKSLDQMGKEYEEIYTECMMNTGKHLIRDFKEAIVFKYSEQPDLVSEQESISSLSSDTNVYLETLKEEVLSLRNRLYELENSPAVRCALKIRKVPFPGKSALKNLYKYIMGRFRAH